MAKRKIYSWGMKNFCFMFGLICLKVVKLNNCGQAAIHNLGKELLAVEL